MIVNLQSEQIIQVMHDSKEQLHTKKLLKVVTITNCKFLVAIHAPAMQ